MRNLNELGLVELKQDELETISGGRLKEILIAIGTAILLGIIARENL